MERNRANEEFVDYEGFKDFEIEKVKRNLEHMKKELSRDKLLRDRADRKSLNEHDARRGTDFLATFEMRSQFYFMRRSGGIKWIVEK